MDQLRFGEIDHPDTARVLPGVVGGISGYGNSLGLPNIGGETVFDASYQGNPLVNALAVGVLRHEDIRLANASGTGNKVVLFGARTGGDGIGGASILASESFDDTKPSKRPAVQVGDPFAEKVLIEVCLELFRRGHRRRHPGPRRRRHQLRDVRTRLQRRRRHAHHPRGRPPPRSDAHTRRDPHVRVPGADDGGRPAGPARRVPRDHRQVGGRGERAGRGDGHRAPGHRMARRRHRRRPAAVRRPRRSRLRPSDGGPLVDRRDAAGHGVRRRTRHAAERPGDPRHPAHAGRLPEPGVEGLDHAAVRPVRAGQHRPVVPGRRRGDPRGRADGARDRPGHRCERPVQLPRPVGRRQARPVRGPTGTSRRPAPAPWP